MSKEAMKLALEALVRSRKAVSGDLDLAGCAYGKNDPDGHRYADAKTALVTLDKAIKALREALAEQPASKPWVGLTDEEMDDCWNKLFGTGNYNRRNVYRAIEAKLKEKNT